MTPIDKRNIIYSFPYCRVGWLFVGFFSILITLILNQAITILKLVNAGHKIKRMQTENAELSFRCTVNQIATHRPQPKYLGNVCETWLSTRKTAFQNSSIFKDFKDAFETCITC